MIYCESHNSKNYLKINNLLEKSHKIIRDYKKNNDLFLKQFTCEKIIMNNYFKLKFNTLFNT